MIFSGSTFQLQKIYIANIKITVFFTLVFSRNH